MDKIKIPTVTRNNFDRKIAHKQHQDKKTHQPTLYQQKESNHFNVKGCT